MGKNDLLVGKYEEAKELLKYIKVNKENELELFTLACYLKVEMNTSYIDRNLYSLNQFSNYSEKAFLSHIEDGHCHDQTSQFKNSFD